MWCGHLLHSYYLSSPSYIHKEKTKAGVDKTFTELTRFMSQMGNYLTLPMYSCLTSSV